MTKAIDKAEAARLAKNAWQREYMRKHPEKRKEYNDRYWAKKFAEMTAEVRESV